MKRLTFGKAAVGAALCAGLLVGTVAPQTAHAHILVKDDGEWLTLRYTVKGTQGQLFRVRRESSEGRRALRSAEKAAQGRLAKARAEALQARGTVALTGANSNCRAVKYWKNKGATGAAWSGQKLIRCVGQVVCEAPLCTADMTCAGAVA